LRWGERCRALLTDVNLGGITGWELARQIREITPDFPVLYMTSASAPDWESQGVGGSDLIQKPFAPAHLAAAVSQLLDNRASPS
jgi:CheY-like chemotaxis protein